MCPLCCVVVTVPTIADVAFWHAGHMRRMHTEELEATL